MSKISFDIDMDNDLYEKITRDYDNGNYTAAINNAILHLFQSIRDKTDLDLDGDKLVTKAFSLNNPLLKINKLETQTDQDEQLGYMLLFQGMYKAIRNPRSHNLITDSKKDADNILIFLNLLANAIESAKPKFDFYSFLSLIDDPHFPRTLTYTDEIIKRIPNEKILDVAIKLCEHINITNSNNIALTIKSLLRIFTETEKEKFIDNCNSTLIRECEQYKISAYIVVLENYWDKIDKACRIRISSMLINALASFKFIYETTTDDYNNYHNEKYVDGNGEFCKYLGHLMHGYNDEIPFITIKPIIEEKMQEIDQADYLLSYLSFLFFDKNYQLYPGYKDLFAKLLMLHNKRALNLLINDDGSRNYSNISEIDDAIENYMEL